MEEGVFFLFFNRWRKILKEIFDILTEMNWKSVRLIIRLFQDRLFIFENCESV